MPRVRGLFSTFDCSSHNKCHRREQHECPPPRLHQEPCRERVITCPSKTLRSLSCVNQIIFRYHDWIVMQRRPACLQHRVAEAAGHRSGRIEEWDRIRREIASTQIDGRVSVRLPGSCRYPTSGLVIVCTSHVQLNREATILPQWPRPSATEIPDSSTRTPIT